MKNQLIKSHVEKSMSSRLQHEYQSVDKSSSLKIEEEWLNSEEAARYLKITVRTLYNLTSNGKIPHHKFGRRNRYLLTELRSLLTAQPRGVPSGY